MTSSHRFIPTGGRLESFYQIFLIVIKFNDFHSGSNIKNTKVKPVPFNQEIQQIGNLSVMSGFTQTSLDEEVNSLIKKILLLPDDNSSSCGILKYVNSPEVDADELLASKLIHNVDW